MKKQKFNKQKKKIQMLIVILSYKIKITMKKKMKVQLQMRKRRMMKFNLLKILKLNLMIKKKVIKNLNHKSNKIKTMIKTLNLK